MSTTHPKLTAERVDKINFEGRTRLAAKSIHEAMAHLAFASIYTGENSESREACRDWQYILKGIAEELEREVSEDFVVRRDSAAKSVLSVERGG